MDADVTISQSRWGFRTRFDFAPERVIYTTRDGVGERSFSAPYEAIAIKAQSRFTHNNHNFAWRLRLIPISTFVFSYLIAGEAHSASVIINVLSIMALIVIFLCGYAKAFAVKFVMVPLSPSPMEAQGRSLNVIDDRNGGRILAEFASRRKDRLRTLYRDADPACDPDLRKSRLNWLRENEIITDEEYAIELSRRYEEYNDQEKAAVPTRLN